MAEKTLLQPEQNLQLPTYDQETTHHEPEPLRPDFSKAELNQAVLPKRIAKEIRGEKYWILLINLLGTGALIVATFFLLAWYVAKPVYNEKTGITTKWLVDQTHLPQPWLMFILLAFGLLIFIVSWIEYAHVISSVNRYKGDILLNLQSVPFFLVKSYRAAVARVIYLNWICISMYVICGISIGILFAISAAKPSMPLITEKRIFYIILGLTFIFHIFSLILIKYRKGNLNAFYGKDLVSLDDQKTITKTANKRCLFIFVVVISVVLVFIVVPWMLIRKKKGLKPVPFL